MDTYGNFELPANELPERCAHCTFPDIEAVPQPYLLRRGIEAPGEFSTAQLGNFFVRAELRRILEVVMPGSCRFYPTTHYRTGSETDWFLAVPQTQVQTVKLPRKTTCCKVCDEPKYSANFDHETELFTPYADNFAAAVHRLASGE